MRAAKPKPSSDTVATVVKGRVARASSEKTEVLHDKRVENHTPKRKKPSAKANEKTPRAPNRKPKALDIGHARRVAKHERAPGAGQVGNRQALPGGAGKMFK
jgi:hypothetical protein